MRREKRFDSIRLETETEKNKQNTILFRRWTTLLVTK
jgi:hypothetical protein